MRRAQPRRDAPDSHAGGFLHCGRGCGQHVLHWVDERQGGMCKGIGGIGGAVVMRLGRLCQFLHLS